MITRPLVLSAVDSLDTIVERFNDHCFSVWEGRRGRRGCRGTFRDRETCVLARVYVCMRVIVLCRYGGQVEVEVEGLCCG